MPWRTRDKAHAAVARAGTHSDSMGHTVTAVTAQHMGHTVTAVTAKHMGHTATAVTAKHMGHTVTAVTAQHKRHTVTAVTAQHMGHTATEWDTRGQQQRTATEWDTQQQNGTHSNGSDSTAYGTHSNRMGHTGTAATHSAAVPRHALQLQSLLQKRLLTLEASISSQGACPLFPPGWHLHSHISLFPSPITDLDLLTLLPPPPSPLLLLLLPLREA